MWNLEFTTRARKDLIDLENKTAAGIIKRLEQAAENPQHYLERLVGREEYRLRSGDYRAIIELAHKNETIIIQSIDHRKNVYKRRTA